MDAQPYQSTLDAALEYAAKTWPVFLCKPNEKVPLPTCAPHGFKSATTDPNTIREWLNQNPSANLAIATGERAGFFVLDIDRKNGKDGFAHLDRYETEHGQLPPTRVICTPTGGGGHYFYRWTPDCAALKSTAIKIGGKETGIDVKTNGGYVVTKPSRTPDGEYTLATDLPIADAPQSLIDYLIAGQQDAPRPGPQPRQDWHETRDPNEVLQAVLGRLDCVQRRGDRQYMARCPAHEDGTPSLSVGMAEGKVLIKCFAGCKTETIVSAIGLTMAGLFTDRRDHAERNNTSTAPKANTSNFFDAPPLNLGELGEPSPFPCDTIPAPLANMVRDGAESLQVPPDLLALAVLAVAAGGVSRKFIVNGDGGQWTEPLNLFTAVAAEPGERKSAALRLALAPVQELERQEIERMRPIVAAAAAEKETLNQRLKKLQSDVSKIDKPEERAKGMRDIACLAVEVENYLVPAIPTLIVDDETQESVGKTLAQNEGRLLQAAAEGTLFEIAGGRYSDGENYDIYLKGHAGDPLICGRTSRERYRVERPALTCAMLVQPEVLRKIGSEKARGLGFLGRWAFGVPTPAVGYRRCQTAPVPELVQLIYAEVVRQLWTWPIPQEETILVFDDDAAKHLLDWRDQIELRLRPDGDLRPLGAWGSKLVGLAVRIAGVCHLVEEAVVHRLNDPTPIGLDRLTAAIKLSESYLIPHAFRAFGLMAEPPGERLAKRLLAWLTRKTEIAQFREQQAYQQLKGARGDCRTVADLKPALELLQAHGYLQAVPTPREPGPGRTGSTVFAVNPQWNRC